MWILSSLIGLAIGTGLATQSVVNATVTRTLGIWGATLVSFSTGAALMLLMALLTRQTALRQLLSVPVWLLLCSGTIGCLTLAGRTWLVPRVGVQTTMALVMVGQLVSGAVLDHLGLLGFQQHSFTTMRGLGLALPFAGMFLVIR